jgi:hypothetical protein
MPDQASWPACDEHSDTTWQAIIVALATVLVALGCVSYGAWMIFKLVQMKLFVMNAVSQALVFTMMSQVFVASHQAYELNTIIKMDKDLSWSMYRPGGVGGILLTCIGVSIIVSSLKLPLLWLDIASSSMSKADADAKNKRTTRIVNGASLFFLVTFFGLSFVMGTDVAGQYSLLWVLILVVAFNYGSRKLASQLTKPGETPVKTVIVMKRYVTHFTCANSMYVFCVVAFVVSRSDRENWRAEKWAIWAGLLYHALAQVGVSNTLYIRRTLDKKLTKFAQTGSTKSSTVVPSSVE